MAISSEAPQTKATAAPRPTRQNRPREFAKSAVTRQRILNAAVACLVDLGYAGTTTNVVADRAGLARSAMQYHFPTRPGLVAAAVVYIHSERNDQYRRAMQALPAGVDKIDASIDIYWAQIRGPLFVAYNEVHFAARTDPELAAILTPVTEAYEQQRDAIHKEIFPERRTDRGVSVTREIARFLVEGMALAELTYGAHGHTDEVLRQLKQTLRRMIQEQEAAS
jgi:AcrR family transcriptional regulator